jgi:hypothetical protein
MKVTNDSYEQGGLLSPADVAKLASVCTKTVLTTIAQSVPVIRLNRRTLRFRRVDVEAYLDARTCWPTAQEVGK